MAEALYNMPAKPSMIRPLSLGFGYASTQPDALEIVDPGVTSGR